MCQGTGRLINAFPLYAVPTPNTLTTEGFRRGNGAKIGKKGGKRKNSNNFFSNATQEVPDGRLPTSVHNHRDRGGHYHRMPHLSEADDSGDRVSVGKEHR